MSLEEALNRNSDLIEKQILIMEKMLGKAGAGSASTGTAAADEGADKPKATRGKGKTKETESDDTALTNDGVKAIVSAWLAEFKGVEGDEETEARKAAIKKALASLTKKEGATIADVPVADLPRVIAWLDKKKAEDNGHGVGRLTAPPSEDAGEVEEDAEDI